MDFGALHCKPQNPLCCSCPFSESCVALEQNLTKELPVKEKKIKVKQRYFNYLVIVSSSGKTILSERKEKGIWQGLYQFPLIETNKNISLNELILKDEFVNSFPLNSSISLFNKKEIIHKLSHQHLNTKFWIIETENSKEIKIKWAEIEKYPVPILIANFLEAFLPKK